MASGMNPYQTPDNSYQPPVAAQVIDALTPGVWRSGSVLVMSKDAQLPARCVKTNQPAERWLKRSMTWHHPAIALTILASPVIYIIIALIVRKSANIQVGLTEERFSKRRMHLTVAWTLGLVSIAAMLSGCILSDALQEYTLVLLFGGLALGLAALIYGQYATRVVAPKKIDDHYVWLTGVCREYLAELPQWPH